MLRDAVVALCLSAGLALVWRAGPSGVRAHPTFYPRDALNPACSATGAGGPPEIYSFHIHTLFWQSNNDSTAAAFALRDAFAQHFGLSENGACDDSNVTHPPTTMCLFEPDYPLPAGPFLTCEWSVFVPPPFYAEAVIWMTQRRGDLDIFVHPNSGCEIEDHTLWPLWGGKPWEIDVSAFHYDCPGCSSASCRASGEYVMFTAAPSGLALPGAVPLDVAARDLHRGATRAVSHAHLRTAGHAHAHTHKRSVASMQRAQALPYQQCGLALTQSGAPFVLADAGAFCTDWCQSWAQQLQALPVNCPHNCDLFTGEQETLCDSYLATVALGELSGWIKACPSAAAPPAADV